MAVGSASIGSDSFRPQLQDRQTAVNEDRRLEAAQDDQSNDTSVANSAAVPGSVEPNPDNVVSAVSEVTELPPASTDTEQAAVQPETANPAADGDLEAIGALIDIEV